MKAFLMLAVPPLIGKLGEDHINMRNTAFFLLKSLIVTVKKNTLLKSLCLFLNSQLNIKSPNWHIKEETLNLVSLLFLYLFDSKEDWYEDAFRNEVEGDDPNYVSSFFLVNFSLLIL